MNRRDGLVAKAAFEGYALLGHLATPLVRHYLHRRLAQGREEAERLAERLGQTNLSRPDGPRVRESSRTAPGRARPEPEGCARPRALKATECPGRRTRFNQSPM